MLDEITPPCQYRHSQLAEVPPAPPDRLLHVATTKEATMRTPSLLLALLALAAGPALAQDPVVVDSEHYKLEFENEHVRVLRTCSP